DFMLPHFVWQDFTDVLDDLAAAGYRFEPEWFLPHFEFRFPKIGGIAQRGIELELRHALEPWHVLGEETSGGCTYHVVHPGGRNYEHVPVNANEAEARRRARFAAIGHTPGETPEPRELSNPDRPLTLDLRLASGL
ncbi:MAG TPA: transglutaminase family protein, partial [Reyranella sp.]|nr:transglutaminase family protein [Reyranella sp.]